MLRRLAIAGAMLVASIPVGKAECGLLSIPSKPSPISIMCDVYSAMVEVESAGDPMAFNAKEEARGEMQTRPIMVREINRRCGTNYTNEDCFDPIKTTIMFVRLQLLTNTELNPEKAARIWNGGYRGMQKETTLKYWKSVKAVING